MNETSIIDLNMMNFHDQSFKSIIIDFEKKTIEYSIDIYDEKAEDYNNKKLCFEGIANLEFDGFKLSQIRDLTILSIEFKKIENMTLCETKLIDDIDGVFTSIHFFFKHLVIFPKV